jgi:hypothetical protein
VDVRDAAASLDLAEAVEIIKGSMRFSESRWTLSNAGGELSKFGMELSLASRAQPGMDTIQIMKNNETFMATLERNRQKQLDFSFRLPEWMIILDALWCGLGFLPEDGAFRENSIVCERWLLSKDPPLYKETLILLAAMVSCGLGLSAYDWAAKTFVPVIADVGRSPRNNGQRVLGLISRHVLRHGELQNFDIKVVQRNSGPALPTGCNLVLYSNRSSIGLLPDFLELLSPDEVLQESLTKLHYNARIVSNRTVGLLDAIFLRGTGDEEDMEYFTLPPGISAESF